jgi:cell division protease FtsH
VLNQQTTGAGDDREKATEMARKMICEWGMSDKLGPLTFGKNEEHIFLGREVARQKDYSEDTALMIDSEIKRIVLECASRAKQILQENIEKLHALARALLERETLDGEEIARILRTRPLQEAGAPA